MPRFPAIPVLAAAATLAIVIAASLASSTAAHSSGVPLRMLEPEVRDSAELHAPVLVTGTLLDAAGRPAIGGIVVAFAWPPSDVLRALRPRDTVPRAPVGNTLSGLHGRFPLPADPSG